MTERIRPLLNAIQFMTVLPTRGAARLDADWVLSAVKYFPLVGAMIGFVCAGVLLIASTIWTGTVAATLAILAGVILTGALHEDGVADTADGLFGGRTREQRLLIIKDSRIGSYGAVTLVASLLLRIVVLASLPPWLGAAALVAGHSLGRAGIVLVMSVLPYAGNVATAKLNYPTQRIGTADAIVAAAFTALGMMWLVIGDAGAAACGLAGAVIAGLLPALAAHRLLGGYVGDVLGATEQLAQIGLLLGVAAIAGGSQI
ncbi:cobalamin-5'-phosphate synthase [Rhodopseudomonas palustris HaA2]|uniref:Adenosylcobinamide-GDP ribazoletransferase n=1 Tax=Rhodopseudomonas palustris (strain HaA2) TaxID=316058 RepID=Q2IUY1_RHOP2|nr:adenosylcobinamide-GDP ribazoletransferase [Rhodopseudomonas palustris]ABD07979.1 cobalamin-5'-phosphate synthase [Rhodopseudomonas palustris HaA2]